MYEIEVRDEFSAAHFLKLYDGSWEPRHGHNWRVAVVLRSERLDSMGVVADFEAVRPALRGILDGFEKISINDHEAFRGGRLNPSTENIAKVIHDQLSARLQNAKIEKVTVWETSEASASYLGSDPDA